MDKSASGRGSGIQAVQTLPAQTAEDANAAFDAWMAEVDGLCLHGLVCRRDAPGNSREAGNLTGWWAVTQYFEVIPQQTGKPILAPAPGLNLRLLPVTAENVEELAGDRDVVTLRFSPATAIRSSDPGLPAMTQIGAALAELSGVWRFQSVEGAGGPLGLEIVAADFARADPRSDVPDFLRDR